MIIEIIRKFAGKPPEHFEWLEYTVTVLMFLILFSFLTTLLKDMGRFFGGR